MSMWMVETLLASALLMALVMLLRRPIAQHLGARAAYWLWALPLLRLLLPPLPRNTPVAAVLPAPFDGGRDFIVYHVTGGAGVGISAQGLPWVELAIAVWMAGLLAFALVQIVAYARFRRLMLSDSATVGREGRVTLIESAHATGPLAFGVLRKYVVLPIDFTDRYTVEERAMAIAHELTHHDRQDLAANMAALAMLGLHWCNPLAWIAYRAFRADQELACDAAVLAVHGDSHAQAYGRAILKAASGRQFAAACHLKSVDNLKGRLKMLSNHSKSLHRISWGMTAVAVVTAAGLALTASGSRAAQEMASVSKQVGSAKLIRLASFLPAPPAAPAPPASVDSPAAPAAPSPVSQSVAVLNNADDADRLVAPEPPVPPVPPVPPRAADGPSMQHIVVRTRDGKTVTRIDGEEIAANIPDIDVQENCVGGEPVQTDTRMVANGRTQRVRINICAKDIERNARAQAMAGLKQARDQMARDRSLSAEIRAEVLADIDDEIAKMNFEKAR